MEEEDDDDEWRLQQFYLDVISVEEEGESGGGPTRFHGRASCAFQSASYQVWVLSSFLILPPPFLGSLCKFTCVKILGAC
jgi:hypothetical protein